MTTKERKGGLGARAPEKDGRARDCYEVATTTGLLLGQECDSGIGRDRVTHNPREAARHAVTLHGIAGQLRRIAERECSPGGTCATCRGDGELVNGETGQARECRYCAGTGRTFGKRAARLRADAEEIAAHYGLRCYFQTDPRGCPLYLIDPGTVPAGSSLRGGSYQYANDTEPMDEKLRARWVDANYTQGHAVAWVGR